MNKIIISGNLCKDLEVSYTKQTNTKVGKFVLAVRKDKESADFIQCIAYGKTVDFMEKYCNKKGQKTLVTGRLQTRHYTDKDSKEVYVTEIIVEEVEFCEPKKDQFGNEKQENPFTKPQEFTPVTDEVLPF